MAEKQMSLGSFKTTVPAMKLFAAGELDRTPPSCIPRLCNVTVTRLQVLQPLGVELASVTLAVKMQNSKRILRSNEIPLTQNGLLDTELQLSFSLQYPHFLKRDGNTLQIMLQRRKKYKNRTFLGCKTLALGLINMSQVLQRPIDRDLDLYFEGKDKSLAVAKVNLVSLSSQPVDTEEPIDRPKHFFTDNPDRVVDLDDSDEDEDYSSQDDGSDSEPILDSASTHHHHHPPSSSFEQRNLKQRFIALLKRFKVPEALQAFDQDQDLDTRPDVEVDEAEIEDLFDELEDLSDSGPEVDTISITSTPKPSLRPYFSSSRSLLTEGLNITGTNTAEKLATDRMSDESSKRADSDHMEAWTDQEQSDTQGLASSPPREDKSKSSNKSKFFRDPNNMSLKEKRGSSSSSTPRQGKNYYRRGRIL
ncbi:Phosphofurin acidic cluster sorting protein 1 [Armadillidium nasatum]|uniref:Phosphofurin acidic cluster sorting protein 1 n=1 Tax=Armadillidium nasatum TaxID=96803 RepID=A0A5N5TJ39_9CRUS|nr:Phosphofurin acidic cluster sorting protein 1 [Armadillidium nasatum]